MSEIILVGGGLHARSCIDVIEYNGDYKIKYIIDSIDNKLGYQLKNQDEVDMSELKMFNMNISVGQLVTGEHRKSLFNKFKKAGCNFPSIVSKTSYFSKSSKIEEGSIVFHKSVVNTNSLIGKNCIINTGSIVEHDTIIKDNVHVGPGAIILGNCIIEENCFIGSNSVIKQGTSISANTIIPSNIYVK